MNAKTKTAPKTAAIPKADPKDVAAAEVAQPLTKPKREMLSIPEKFDLMSLINGEYTKRGLTDAEFASAATSQLGFTVAPATIKHYREAFGIEQVKQASAAELKARIAELEAKLQLAAQPVLPAEQA
jgi:hypothetical protein